MQFDAITCLITEIVSPPSPEPPSVNHAVLGCKHLHGSWVQARPMKAGNFDEKPKDTLCEQWFLGNLFINIWPELMPFWIGFPYVWLQHLWWVQWTPRDRSVVATLYRIPLLNYLFGVTTRRERSANQLPFGELWNRKLPSIDILTFLCCKLKSPSEFATKSCSRSKHDPRMTTSTKASPIEFIGLWQWQLQ